MQRKMVTEKELLAFLNSELNKTEPGEGVFFESLTRLRVDDRDGCNWSSAVLKGCDPPGSCPAEAEKIVHWARERFNLKD